MSDPGSAIPPQRPLPVLRAMIDAVDRDMLALMSRRNAIVAEVAEFKRQNAVAIRDHVRERELLADRRDRGTSLGLNPEVIESLFRLVLWASRDRQASLRAEVPLNMEPRAVAIVGGSGAMGRCLGSLFADLGHVVMTADLDTPLTPIEATRAADVVVISVPIESTLEVIRELGPHMRDDALLMDVTSIKRAPLTAMLESSRSSVIGTHPLFGPSVHTVQGQRIVLTPGRGDEWLAWLRRMLSARGLIVHESTAEAHDRAMSIVQVLTHFSTEVLGRTLSRIAPSLDETLDFTSPVYRLDLLMTGRHFAQSADLYAAIQMSNDETPKVVEAFEESTRELASLLSNGDIDGIRDVFTDVRSYFGDFTDEALEASSYLIDRLVERGA